MVRFGIAFLALVLLASCGSSSEPQSQSVGPTSAILFTAYNQALGESLWKSDGTTEGTKLVKDISPYIAVGSSQISELTSFNGKTFFLFSDQGSGQDGLWKTDGTDAGTQLVKSFPTNIYSQLTPVQRQLFFSANNIINGEELWKSDGSTEGTAMVADLTASVVQDVSSAPLGLTAFGDIVLFSAHDLVHGFEIWRSDGSVAGTSLVKDIAPGPGNGGSSNLTLFKDRVWFASDSTQTGELDLWSTDGTDSGTVQFTHLSEPSTGAQILGVANDHLFFRTWNYTTVTEEVWATDGTEAGTGMLMSHSLVTSEILTQNSATSGDLLFFMNYHSGGDTEIWRTDGTADGTFVLTNPQPSQWVPATTDLAVFNGELYFHIHNLIVNQIWKTDGSDAGTTLVTDLSLPKYQNVYPNFLQFFPTENGLLFGTGAYSVHQLFATDGTEAGTVMVKDISSE